MSEKNSQSRAVILTGSDCAMLFLGGLLITASSLALIFDHEATVASRLAVAGILVLLVATVNPDRHKALRARLQSFKEQYILGALFALTALLGAFFHEALVRSLVPPVTIVFFYFVWCGLLLIFVRTRQIRLPQK